MSDMTMADGHRADGYRDAAGRTGLTGPVLAAALVIAGFFGVLGGWAATAPLAGAAIAPGVVRVVDNRQTLQHPDGGVVGAIEVRDGDAVQAGQVLLRLDSSDADAVVAVLQAQYRQAAVTAARLVAERDDSASIALPADLAAHAEEPAVAGLLAAQDALLQARRATVSGEQAMLDQRVVQLEQQQAAHRGHIASLDRQLVLVRKEAAGVRDLHSRGHAPLTRVVALERQIAALEGELAGRHAALASTQEEVRLTRLDMDQRGNARAADIAARLDAQGERLRDLTPKLRAAIEVRRRTELRAPMAGRVVDLAVFTVGGVIRPGDRVLDIVPQHSELVVEAELDPADIARIAAGQMAKVTVPALPRRMAELDGRIRQISADRSQPVPGDRAFYRMLVAVEAPDGAALTSGMAAVVTVPTEARTLLEYLLIPLRDRMALAMRER